MMTSDQVMGRIAADKSFYDHSGGGVTFSGGEPFAQPAFLEELLARSRQLGIHTAVETCGYADPGVFARCESLVDLFLYDLKIMDPARHERLTGVSNAVILENLHALAAKAPHRLAVRVPLVPGCTDDPPNLAAIAAFVDSLGIPKLELIPYHTLGADKYASLGRNYPLARQSLGASAVASPRDPWQAPCSDRQHNSRKASKNP
jgi:pyruvate formate lyase activating enzyme